MDKTFPVQALANQSVAIEFNHLPGASGSSLPHLCPTGVVTKHSMAAVTTDGRQAAGGFL
jgi:hypothetical protein